MRASKFAVAMVWVLGVVLFLGVGVAPAAAQEAGPGPGRVEISGSYTLVRNEFSNHATSVTVAVPTARRWAPRFQFINVPTVGQAYVGGVQYRRNLADLKIPASAQFNPKYFDVVANAQAGVFKNRGGEKAAAVSIGARLEFTPAGSDVTLVVFDYQRLRSQLIQGPLRLRNNNLVSAGITWAIARK